MAFILARIKKRPTVLKLPNSGRHGIEPITQRGVFGRVGITRGGLRLASAVVATSDRISGEASAFFSESTKIVSIPNGLDTELFSDASSSEKNTAGGENLNAEHLVISIGRLQPQKNHSLLLHAWSLIPEDIRSEAQLAIIGNGPLKDALLKEAESLGIWESVRLPGQSDDVRMWYQAADVFVLSSDYEGLSNAMLEAMASGLPVVMTRVGGHEWVSAEPHCGIVTAVGDAQAFSKAIEHLILNPSLRSELGKNARQRAVDRAGISAVAEKTLSLYRDILSDKCERP